MGNLRFLIVYIIVLVLQLAVITCDGFVVTLFLRHRRFRWSPSHRLLLFLTLTDFLHAVTTLPYIIYLTAHWNPALLDLDSQFVLISGAPLVAQLKINLTLTVSIALERTLALLLPITYRKLSSSSTYAMCCLLIGCMLAIFDLIIEYALAPEERTQNCGALGCFTSDTFRYYWGGSNMANRTSAGILISSLLFITIPSVIVGSIKMLGYQPFSVIGPFYTVGLLCSGFCNGILYMALNREMRELAKNCMCSKGERRTILPLSTRVYTSNKRRTYEASPITR